MIFGFPPILGPEPRVLVLGTIPSVASLEAGRYYAHPRNAFWPLMEALFAEGRQLEHEARCMMLAEHGVAVWDVLAAAERQGSLDSEIVTASEVPNDIAGLVRDNPTIRAVFFNGTTAEKLFSRHVAPSLPAGRELTLRRLPSTSPAHAGLTFAAKLEAWREVAEAAAH